MEQYEAGVADSLLNDTELYKMLAFCRAGPTKRVFCTGAAPHAAERRLVIGATKVGGGA